MEEEENTFVCKRTADGHLAGVICCYPRRVRGPQSSSSSMSHVTGRPWKCCLRGPGCLVREQTLLIEARALSFSLLAVSCNPSPVQLILVPHKNSSRFQTSFRNHATFANLGFSLWQSQQRAWGCYRIQSWSQFERHREGRAGLLCCCCIISDQKEIFQKGSS